MILIGIIILLWQSRSYIRVFNRAPIWGTRNSLRCGFSSARLAIEVPGVLGSYWRTGGVKAIVFRLVYMSIIFAFERKELPILINYAKNILPKKGTPPDRIENQK